MEVTKRHAIVLLGKQNSGKTSTIVRLENRYTEEGRDGRRKKAHRAGWRYLVLFPIEAVFALTYIVPASPSETDYPLKDRVDSNNPPELLIVAEQTDGQHREGTYAFLEKHGYEIVTIELRRGDSSNMWGDWTKETRNSILDQRSEYVADLLRKFITENLK